MFIRIGIATSYHDDQPTPRRYYECLSSSFTFLYSSYSSYLALDTSFYPNQGGVSSSSSTLLAYAESQANRYRGIGPLDQVYE